ncbi:MAG: glycosyltransferase [Chloroflexi bacterium]|nr:glycosyltransferase [Chloroflexota bacterium]
MAVAVVFVTLALTIMALTAIVNALVFPRLRISHLPTAYPRVSVLIPARNEVAVIGQTVSHLLNQSYPDFEIIVLDDHSTDGTLDAARRAAQGEARVRVITGQPLPPGWLGKNWACQQLAAAATGDWLVFTDADVRWLPGALTAVAAMMQTSRADLLTVWPTQQTESWGERLVVPLLALAIVAYLPLPLVHHTSWRAFAAANGQCLAFRRAAYERVGRHAAVKGQIVEDVALARQVKANGLRLRVADGAGLVACRMYRDWPSVRDGFAKNILAGHGNSMPLLLLSAVFHWLVFVLPWLWFISGQPSALLLVGLGVAVRALAAAVSRQRIADAMLLPISVLLMTLIAGRAIWWRSRYGGARWKDRMITQLGSAARG